MKQLTIEKVMDNSKEIFFANHMFQVSVKTTDYTKDYNDYMLVVSVFITDTNNLGIDNVINTEYIKYFADDSSSAFNFMSDSQCELIFFRESVIDLPIQDINEVFYRVYKEAIELEDFYYEFHNY